MGAWVRLACLHAVPAMTDTMTRQRGALLSGSTAGVAFGEMDGYGVTRFLAECGQERFGDGEFVGAITEGHEGSVERLIVDGSADLVTSASPEEFGGPVGYYARPRSRVFSAC